MVKVFLDMALMETAEEAKRHIKEILKLHGSFSGSPDALHGLLCSIGRPTCICLVNTESITQGTPAYESRLLKAFLDASRENENISVEII